MQKCQIKSALPILPAATYMWIKVQLLTFYYFFCKNGSLVILRFNETRDASAEA